VNDWTTRPLRALANVTLGRQRSPQHDDGPHMIPYLRAANVSDGRLNLDDVKEMNFTPDEQHVFALKPGDVLVTEGSGSLGAVGASAVWHGEIPGTIGFQNTLLRLRPRSDATDPRFLEWWCRSAFADGVFASIATGANIFHLSAERLRALPIRYPSRDEQRAISCFLDAEATRIDALIAKKRYLAKLAEERYQTTVDFATEQGKPIAVRRVTSLITSGPRGWSDRVGDDGRPFIRSANLRRDRLDLRSDNLQRVAEVASAEGFRSRTHLGDTVIGITGANTGWVGLVDSGHASGYVSQHVALLRPSSVLPEWLAFSLRGRRVQEQLAAGQYGGTKQQLGLEDLADASICVPSPDEQIELVRFLRSAAEHNTRLTALLARQIELLQEHRQALITAVVTGCHDTTVVPPGAHH
jgi:type I restriction enzyme, S subunit